MMTLYYSIRKSLVLLPKHEKRLTLSTWVTLTRLLLTPCVVLSLFSNMWFLAFALFFIAALTDIVDGALARFMGEQTFLGACLDPIADKCLIVSCFLTLSVMKTPLFVVPSWFAIAVFLKEIVLLGGSFFIYKKTQSLRILPTILGKLSTFVQVCFILWIFFCYFFGWVPVRTYAIFLGIMSVLLGVTLVQYGRIGYKHWSIKK